jgi:hypothetical protein
MRRTAAAVLAGAAALLAACSSSGGSGADNPVVTPPQPSSASSAAPPSASPSSSAPSSAPASVSSSAPAPSSSAPSSSRTARPPAGSPAPCAAEQLTSTLLRGGAIQHQQLAVLVFTNSSGPTCTLHGYPGAQLVVAGRPIGTPARHVPGGTPTVRLVHGASAQATLTATTECQAPLSDHVRVRPPGVTTTVDLADRLRDCTVSVTAVAPS